MALIKCKYCGKEISDKAQACPGCGQPVENNVYQDDKKDVNHNINKKKLYKILIGIAILGGLAVFVVLSTRKMPKSIKKSENNIVEEDVEKTEKNTENIEVYWEDGTAPTEVGGGKTIAKILDTKIVNSSEGTLLVMSFEYSNNSNDARNFINDNNCCVIPFQNGIELETPGCTSEEGVYDSNDAYSNVKNGGLIKTELAWILRDDVSPVEIEFGEDGNYDPDYIETIVLKGGTKVEEKNINKEFVESDYKIVWNNDMPQKIGNENEQAIIKNVVVIDSANYGTVLVMDIDFINNLEESRNLINNMACSIMAYQNGIELETPGCTSDENYFDYSDSFTSVKKGGKVSTQLVWSLEDDSPVEIEFGLDEDYEVQYKSSFTFSK